MKRQAWMPLLLALSCCLSARSADWPQFRGPNGSATGSGEAPPVKLEETQIQWRVDLPGRGISSPIIVGDRLFLTAASGPEQDRLHVLCLSADDGSQLWERQFWATGRTMTHPKTCVAANTPCSDGHHIFALYSTDDLVCLDLDGNLLWLRGLMRDYPNASNSLGMASSPMVAGRTLVVPLESESESLTLGIDIDTGINRWKIDRPRSAAWTSPITVPDTNTGEPLVALIGSVGLSVIDPSTGNEVWYYPERCSPTVSGTLANGLLYVPSQGITALVPSASEKRPQVLWKNGQLAAGTASPVVVGERIYTVSDAGVVTCGDVSDGKRLWQLRATGPISASPVAHGPYLYIVSEEGQLQVIDTTAPRGEIVGTLDLGQTIIATPSIAGGGLFVRSDQSLWKID